MSPCNGPRKYFSNAIDGGPIPWWMRFFVATHRTFCPLCIRYEKSLRHTIEAGRSLRDLPLEEEAGNEVPPRPT